MASKNDRLEKALAWMEEAQKVKKVCFHQRLKQAFTEIYEKANDYELFFIIPGEVRGKVAFYRSTPLIVSQTCGKDGVVFHKLPPQAWWCFGHTHLEKYPRLSGPDQTYCAHLGILCTIVISGGKLTDICRFSGGEVPAYKPEVEWIEGPFVEDPQVEIPALPYQFLEPLSEGKDLLILKVEPAERRIVISGE